MWGSMRRWQTKFLSGNNPRRPLCRQAGVECRTDGCQSANYTGRRADRKPAKNCRLVTTDRFGDEPGDIFDRFCGRRERAAFYRGRLTCWCVFYLSLAAGPVAARWPVGCARSRLRHGGHAPDAAAACRADTKTVFK